MPAIISTTFGENLTLDLWNLSTRVGAGGITRGLDVTLSQYLLWRWGLARKDPNLFPRENVIGIWGPKSRATLALLEQQLTSKKWSVDGCIDPIRQGQTQGSISQRVYKMVTMNMEYFISRTDLTIAEAQRQSGMTRDDVQGVISSLPEQDDVPADLRAELIKVRDANTLEL